MLPLNSTLYARISKYTAVRTGRCSMPHLLVVEQFAKGSDLGRAGNPNLCLAVLEQLHKGRHQLRSVLPNKLSRENMDMGCVGKRLQELVSRQAAQLMLASRVSLIAILRWQGLESTVVTVYQGRQHISYP